MTKQILQVKIIADTDHEKQVAATNAFLSTLESGNILKLEHETHPFTPGVLVFVTKVTYNKAILLQN